MLLKAKRPRISVFTLPHKLMNTPPNTRFHKLRVSVRAYFQETGNSYTALLSGHELLVHDTTDERAERLKCITHGGDGMVCYVERSLCS